MASEKVKEHYDVDAEGKWVCKFCGHALANGTSPTRLKFHLSGEGGRGVRICKKVPLQVKEAEYLSVESNKRQKTMPPHRVDVGVVSPTILSSSQEQPSHFDNRGRMMLEPDSRQPVEEIVAPKLTQGDALLTTNLVGEVFEWYMDEIWTWLIGEDVTRIGIWGMAGVGKTELAKHAHNRLLHIPNQFDHVYWVTVSPDFTVHKLQDSFGKSLGIDLSNEHDEHKRAAKLTKTLDGGGCNRCVFILDDVWDYLPLHDRVGIPASTKLILTSRSLDACRMIRCQKKIEIKPLSHEDGWELFKQTLGQEEAEALPSEIVKIARLVCNRCDGLPLAIIWMSIRMREVDDKASWENALEKLRKSTIWQHNTEVFQKLKLSYDYLNDSALQQCFLYCAFYIGRRRVGKEILIAHLIDEGIIRPKRSRKAELMQGHMMLKKLENACLLEEVVYVKMNLVTWDLAYHVWRASCTTMVELWAEFEELPDVEEWGENMVRIALIDNNDLVEIPSSYTPRCPNLLILLLDDNRKLERIACSFFEQFHKLKFLDISWCTEIKKLPDSVSNLVNLTTLLLSGCLELCHVPSLGKLGELKMLDLSSCNNVKEMPEGVGSLSKLKYLDLSGRGIQEIPSGIMANLSGLQVLKLISSRGVWLRAVEVEGRELGRLRELETLECHFQHVSEFMEYMESRRECGKSLSEYTFLIGKFDLLTCGYSRESRKVVLISECHDIKDISALKLNNTTQLEHIAIVKCEGIENLVSWSQESNTVKNLQHLKLYNLDNFRRLVKREEAITAPTSSQFLSNLKRIDVRGCHRLKRLFPPNLLPNLHNVQRIYVSECDGIEEIFAMEEEDDNRNNCPTSMSPINLPNLTKLELRKLPELTSIYSGVVNCHSLEIIELIDCPKLNRIPLHLSQPNSIHIHGCHRLKRPFPPNLLPNLHNLESIDISDCQGMEKIFSMEEEDDNRNNCPTSMSPINLPNLTKLVLSKLPELRSIYSGVVNCHSLKQIELVRCPKLNRIPLHLPQPNSLAIIKLSPQEWWESLLWDIPDHKSNLQPLCAFVDWL